jgi:anaerobic selenocysteine-containing dehydrogenase
MIGGEFPTALLPSEIRGIGEKKIRALFVVGGNPAMALGDPGETVAAFKSLKLLVTIDPSMNETAKLSHYVIATKLPYERPDLTYLHERFFEEPFVQVAAPVVEAPSGTIEDWEFFWGLSRRMGLQLTLSDTKVGAAAKSGGSLLNMDVKPTSEDLIRLLCERAALSYDELKTQPSGTRISRDPIKIVEPASDTGARLDVCPDDVVLELRQVREETADRTYRYRYRLTVRRLLETMNSAYRDARRTRKRYPVNAAYMNPTDMAAEGLSNGSAIEIESDNGKIIGYAKSDSSLRPGIISMAHLWGKLDLAEDAEGREGAFTGHLVSLKANLETINYMPRQSGIPVGIRKFSPG